MENKPDKLEKSSWKEEYFAKKLKDESPKTQKELEKLKACELRWKFIRKY